MRKSDLATALYIKAAPTPHAQAHTRAGVVKPGCQPALRTGNAAAALTCCVLLHLASLSRKTDCPPHTNWSMPCMLMSLNVLYCVAAATMLRMSVQGRHTAWQQQQQQQTRRQ